MHGYRKHRPEPTDRDVYRSDHTPCGGTHCPECELVVRKGRWVRADDGAQPSGPPQLCPACQRVRDRYPAGRIRLVGDPGELADELRRLARKTEASEREEHPLERLMELEVNESGLTASTTGVHLARRLGSVFERRLRGRIEIRYGEEEGQVRIEGSI
ncbi:MAG: ATPase [bacterium]|nr:ATPase [bacterium]